MNEFLETLKDKIKETAKVVGAKTGVVVDKVSKKTEEVVETVSQKTNEIVEEQKVKSQVRTLERSNKRDFEDIGKMIYERFQKGEGVDLQFVELCENIEKREENIEELKRQVADMKGFDMCSKCHTHLEKGSIYCPKCGTKVTDMAFEEDEAFDE